MGGTSISSEWDLKASLTWFVNALHEALLVQTHVKISIVSMVDRTPIRIMPLNVLALLRVLAHGVSSRAKRLNECFLYSGVGYKYN